MSQQQQSHAYIQHDVAPPESAGRAVALTAVMAIGLAAGVALGTAFALTRPEAALGVAQIEGQPIQIATLPADALVGPPLIDPSTVELAEIKTGRMAVEPASDDALLQAQDAGAPEPVQLAARFGGELPVETPAIEGETALLEAPGPSDPLADISTVEIAETEAEVLAIEERLSAAGAAYFQLPPDAAEPFDAALGEPALPPARTNGWVNLRAAPGNNSEVMMVVPGGAEIGAEEGCRHWCEVVYDGNRGYIYQSFIRR